MKAMTIRGIIRRVMAAQMILHLYSFQKMNLNDFHGEVSQKKEVAGRLGENKLGAKRHEPTEYMH